MPPITPPATLPGEVDEEDFGKAVGEAEGSVGAMESEFFPAPVPVPELSTEKCEFFIRVATFGRRVLW